MARMDGRVALVTGAAQGQGRSHAIGLAKEGADVVITDVCEQYPYVSYPMGTEEGLSETAALVREFGRTCLDYVADARDARQMRETVNDAVGQLGRLDTVVINHGIAAQHNHDSEDADEIWDMVVDTNLSAAFKTMRAAVPHMKENGGSITATGSASSRVGLFGVPAYVAAKHGLLGLVKTMAAELAPHWIRVNAVLPTAVPTNLFLNDGIIEKFCGPGKTLEDLRLPARALNLLDVPWIEPEAVTAAILFLASDDAKYVTGIDLPVDAGMTVTPPGISPAIGAYIYELQQQAARNG